MERARRFDREDLNKDNTQVVSPSFLEEIYQLTRKQHYHGRILLWLSFQSIGVIYGDIGTSPLYVFSSTFNAHPSWDDVSVFFLYTAKMMCS